MRTRIAHYKPLLLRSLDRIGYEMPVKDELKKIINFVIYITP